MPQSDPNPSRLTRFKALLVLVLTLAIGAVVIAALTWFVIGSAPRSQAIALAEDVTVAEFARLPGDGAYPAALAISGDGAVYTGSYQTGALWIISPQGDVREILGARDRIGSVTGLDAAADGALFILDRLTPLDAQGAIIWRYAADELSAIVEIPADETAGVMLPDDIAVDSEGRIYISDRDPARVWRYSRAGKNEGVIWRGSADLKTAPTGLAYDAARDALLISDSERDAVYRLPLTGDIADARATAESLFDDQAQNDYGFDGIAVTSAGDIFLALLNWNRVARLDEGALTMLARDFRGASDLAYDAARRRLFVTNWNQFSLGFGTRPQLPFAIDVIAFPPR